MASYRLRAKGGEEVPGQQLENIVTFGQPPLQGISSKRNPDN
jgi:hypothetical protein